MIRPLHLRQNLPISSAVTPSQQFGVSSSQPSFQAFSPGESNPVSSDLDRMKSMQTQLRVRPSPSSKQTDLRAVQNLSGSFDQIDSSGDGFISESEIRAFRNQGEDKGIDNVVGALPELMFATRQSGDGAYFGLAAEDLEETERRLSEGQTLSEIQEGIREEVFAEPSALAQVALNTANGDRAQAFRTLVSLEQGLILSGKFSTDG